MSIEYTVYANIEAYDDSKRDTNEDDCWHPLLDGKNLAVFNDLKIAEKFLESLPTKE